MTHAKRLWSIWQALLSAFAWAFTRPSFRRFAEWITAMAINGEEHTITQSVLALERPADWKALESFAEYGTWHPDYVTASLTRLVETAPGRLWHGYHSRPSMTPRSIAIARTSGEPAPSTNIPPAVPIELPPCGPTTGWCSGPCSTTPVNLPGACPCRDGSISGNPSCLFNPRTPITP